MLIPRPCSSTRKAGEWRRAAPGGADRGSEGCVASLFLEGKWPSRERPSQEHSQDSLLSKGEKDAPGRAAPRSPTPSSWRREGSGWRSGLRCQCMGRGEKRWHLLGRQHCSGLSAGEHSLLGFALTHMSFNNTARLSNNPGALKKSERPIRPLAPERSLLPSGSQTLMRPLGLPLAEGLTKQKGILSRFWGLEARAPGAIARAGSF